MFIIARRTNILLLKKQRLTVVDVSKIFKVFLRVINLKIKMGEYV